jgi:FtsP/CotA-like multicopper oxidase with cupredoxin domain
MTVRTTRANSRRLFLRGLMAAGGAATASRAAIAGPPVAESAAPQHVHPAAPPKTPAEPAPRGHEQHAPTPAPSLASGIVPVHTPDVPRLPFQMDAGVKVFHLIAEHVRTEFLPGRPVDAWGFNGSMPGPTIEAVEGDRIRIIVENRLPELFAPHWHGLEVPPEMDGVPGISQDPIKPGDRYTYEFTLRQNGTFFYHSHMAMQEMMGMIGFFIVHPRVSHQPRVDRDFGLIFQEWAILPNNTVPNTLSMEFNWLTINGKAGPATTPMIVKQGERVRLRMVNLGMDHHPIHLHGNQFVLTGTEAGRIPASHRVPENTLLLGVAQARDVEFEAKHVGDWMVHCHLPHHMMNQMTSMVGPLMLSHASGARTSDMEAGFGIANGSALADTRGPALGRTVGVGAEPERAVSNGSMDQASTASGQHAGHQMPAGQAPASVPGYPQDMYMVMDDVVAKPETHGLRAGWTAAMMGMMTLVRVVSPELFAAIETLKAEQAAKGRA